MLIQNRIESFVLSSCSPLSKQFESKFFLFSKQFMPCVLAEYFSLETALWNNKLSTICIHTNLLLQYATARASRRRVYFRHFLRTGSKNSNFDLTKCA